MMMNPASDASVLLHCVYSDFVAKNQGQCDGIDYFRIVICIIIPVLNIPIVKIFSAATMRLKLKETTIELSPKLDKADAHCVLDKHRETSRWKITRGNKIIEYHFNALTGNQNFSGLTFLARSIVRLWVKKIPPPWDKEEPYVFPDCFQTTPFNRSTVFVVKINETQYGLTPLVFNKSTQ